MFWVKEPGRRSTVHVRIDVLTHLSDRLADGCGGRWE